MAHDRLRIVGEPAVGMGETVPGVCLAVLVAEFLQQGEGLLAIAQRTPVVAELDIVPADPVEGIGLPMLITRDARERKTILKVPQGVGLSSLPYGNICQTGGHVRLPDDVPQLGVAFHGSAVVSLGLVEAAGPEA